MLPSEFTSYTSQLFGIERWTRYLDSFNEQPPVSLRLNPFKPTDTSHLPKKQAVAWCKDAYYLSERPNFTLDPLLHAGVYYVQEAASMFLDTIVRHHCPTAFFADGCNAALDLCAAPGGKSTLLRAVLPSNVTLMSNEPDRRRANILMENMQKQGHPNVIVTNNYPKDYAKAGISFDFILADVPCSGEGMFRKDKGAIDEWSIQNVRKCAALQRSIIEEIWQCLRPGGILIYSTCTFNTHENEENVQWIIDTFGAIPLCVPTSEEWHITPSLSANCNAPVYRFIPGITESEGLFIAALRKPDSHAIVATGTINPKTLSKLKVLSDGHPVGTPKGKDIIPAHAEALLISEAIETWKKKHVANNRKAYPTAELSLIDALKYLHHEVVILPPDVPRGFVIVTYKSVPLGFVKNIGTRANNLYPNEWKIKTLSVK